MSYTESNTVCSECGKQVCDNESVVCQKCYEDLLDEFADREAKIARMETEIVWLRDRVRELEGRINR